MLAPGWQADMLNAPDKFLISAPEHDADHLRAFLLAKERRKSASSATVHFRNLRVFFKHAMRAYMLRLAKRAVATRKTG